MENNKTVVVLGASSNPQRYSNKVLKELLRQGYSVIAVNPSETIIEQLPAVTSLSHITQPIDTLTVYVNPAILKPLVPSVIALKPRRVILNPGTENNEIEHLLDNNGIAVLKTCTLMLLQSHAF